MKKLSLHKETLRALDPRTLRRAIGGVDKDDGGLLDDDDIFVPGGDTSPVTHCDCSALCTENKGLCAPMRR